jgi:DNA-binding NtrC family response regulator
MSLKKILVVDDEKLIRWSISQKLAEWNFKTVEAETCGEARKLLEDDLPDLVVLDVNLPDKKGTDLLEEIKISWQQMPVIMITAYGSIDDAVRAMRLGAFDFITKPIDYLKLQNAIINALESASLKKEVAYYKEKEQKQFDLTKIIAQSETMKKILEMTQIVAQSETIIVLLQGESGTGKDLLAQAIHYLSRRNISSYLAINCSAIPENLLESELFGYEKGAFTDAKQQKKGLVELAHEGTLFLDEISTLSLPLQAKLLRFLETQTFKRVGGLKDIEMDIRVIVRKNLLGLNKEAQKVFQDYDWPGNVRELKNAIERAMIFEGSPYLTAQYLPIQLNGKTSHPQRPLKKQLPGETMSLADVEKDLLIKALNKSRGNKTQAAKILSITRDALRYKIKKWNISSKDLNLPE